MKTLREVVLILILPWLMASAAYAGVMTTVAGSGSYGYCGDGGAALAACIATPFDVTFDDAGAYYIADHSNDRIRKVDSQGIITTVAGGGSSLASGIDALSARLARPSGLAFLAHGGKKYLYIADRDNARASVLDIEAGTLHDVLTGIPGGVGGIRAVVVDGVLYIYLAAGNGQLLAVTMTDPVTPGVVASVLNTGGIGHIVSYVSGGSTYLVMTEYWAGLVSQVDVSDPLNPASYTILAGGGSDTGDSVPATTALLIEPYGLVRDGSGNLYISEHAFHTRASGNRVRKITPDGAMTTVAGVSGVYGFVGDGGPATEATFDCPTGLTLDPAGNLHVGDDWNHRIRMVTLDACVAPPADMVGWWPGDGTAHDIAGTNHGTMNLGATYEPGLVAQGFSFDGSEGYMRIADHPSLDTPEGFTVDAWIHPRATGGPQVIASKWDDPNEQWSWIFKLHNDGSGRLRIEISRGDHNALGDLGGTTVLPVGAWSHVAATYDRETSQLRLYVNGNLDAQGAAQFPDTEVNSSEADVLIGAVSGQTTPPSEYFLGLIDELELFSRALTASEIRAVYLAGAEGKCKNPVANAGRGQIFAVDGGLRGVFSFDAATGSLGTFIPGDPNNYGYGIYGEACMPDGRFLVTDQGRNLVQAYDGTTGQYLETLVSVEPNSIPTGIAVTPSGNFLVGMEGAGRIVEYGPDGSQVRVFSEHPSLANGPFSMAYGPNGNLFVAVDHGYVGSVVELNRDTGAYVREFAVAAGPRGLTFGPDGHLFVASVYDQLVQEYELTSSSAALVRTFSGLEQGPHGVLVGPDGVLYVGLAPDLARFSLSDGARLDDYAGSPGGSLRELLWSHGTGPCGPLTVAIDIKPGTFPNSINPRNNGVIPVAILTTDSFSAATADPATVRFGAAGNEAPVVQSALEDVDGDGDLDRILHFRTRQTGIVCGTTSGILTGKTTGGQLITGTDSMVTVGCK
jgi:hypothetical protein